jgi:predicted transcriptional regulator
MASLEVYNTIHKLIQSIYSSRLKIQILLAVSQAPKSLSDLRDVTGSTSQALIPKIRSLEHIGFIEGLEKGYILTPVGKIVVKKMENFILTMAVIHKHKEFWSNHDIEGIPLAFLEDIGDILDSDLKFDTTTDILHVYSEYLKMLNEANTISGISQVMSPGLAEALAERVLAGIPVELIVSKASIEPLMKDPYIQQIRMLASYPNFHLWVIEEPLRIGFTVTDRHLSLGLNRRDGVMYDASTDLSSNNPKAVAWGHRLFNYYKERSIPLTL